MGFVINSGQAGPAGPAGETGPAGPTGPLASSETTPWAELTLEPEGATGTLQWRTQLAGQTLQLVGSVTFAAAEGAVTLVATLPNTVTVPQLLAVPVACYATQEAAVPDAATLVIGTDGSITLVPNESATVPAFWVAHSLPLA